MDALGAIISSKVNQSETGTGSFQKGGVPAAPIDYANESDYSVESEEEEVEGEQDEEDDSENTKMIRVTRPRRILWDLFTMLLAFWNALYIPFAVAFKPAVEDMVFMFVINTLIDFIFCGDVVLNFYTTYINEAGKEIFNHKEIVKNYLKFQFWIDLVASVPIDNFVLWYASSNADMALQLTDLLKLIRIFRLGKIIRFTRTRDDIKSAMRLLMLIVYLLLWVHLTGWIWFMTVSIEATWVPVPDFFTGDSTVFDDSVWTQYFRSFYHAVWLLVGGEIGARNTFEAAVGANIIILGALLNAILFGEISVLMASLNRKSAAFNETLGTAMTTMYNMKWPKALQDKILDFITDTQITLTQQTEFEDFQKIISPKIQMLVSAEIFTPIIEDNPVFKHQTDGSCVHFIVFKIKSSFTRPEDVIVEEGTESESVFFLAEGEWEVEVTDEYNEPHLEKKLVKGAHFGEIGLLYSIKRTATVRATKYNTIAELSKRNFRNLINTYPSLRKRMRKFTSKYNDVFKKYLLGILENIPFLANLKDVDEDAFREIVYFMQMKKYKPDEYIFGPGDKITELMLVTEGCLELSGSFESEELAKHRYKSGEQIHASHKLDCSDFYEKYQVGKCDALKRRTEVVPFEKNKAINGYILGYGARAYEEGRPIGDYCHEVVLAELGQGCIINHNVSLVKQITQIQCKALKQTTVYILPIEKIEDIARDHEPFRNKLLSIKEELMPFNAETEENDNKTPLLDYINTEESRGKQLLKKVFMSAIGAWRIKRKTANPDLFEMVPKLQAMEWLDAAGNKTAYKKVVKGEIPYSCVNEDGTLANEESSLSTVAKLHKGHPLMKTVSKITTQLNALTPENMTEIETEQGDQLQALENVANDIEEMNRLLSQVGTLPSINQQPRQQSPPKQDPEQQMYSTDHLNVDPPAYPPQHLPAEVTPEMLFIDVDRVNAAKDERQKKREDRRKAREERKKRKEEEEKNA